MPAIELGKIISAVFCTSPWIFLYRNTPKSWFLSACRLRKQAPDVLHDVNKNKKTFFYHYHPDKADQANNLDNPALADQAGPAGQPWLAWPWSAGPGVLSGYGVRIDLVHCIDLEYFLMVTGKVRYPGTLLYF